MECLLLLSLLAVGAGAGVLRGGNVHASPPADGSRPGCSSPAEEWGDCTRSGCCSGEGLSCYQRDQYFAQCRMTCVPGPDTDSPPGVWSCALLSPSEGGDLPAPRESERVPGPAYTLDWKAEGLDFFDGFDFMTEDGNHGASELMDSLESATSGGVTEVHATHAILRAGRQSEVEFKRATAKLATKKAWKHFLAVVRLHHVPWGCGVWPAIFTLGNGTEWPAGGEMDILEYVNDAGSMTSFHTSQECVLDPTEVNRYKPMPDSNLKLNNGSDYNCLTRYCANCTSVGCAPNVKPVRTGEQWAKTPGAFAMQRTANYTKIFFIPERSLPADLASDAPDPDNWDAFLVSYYPFGLSPGCPAGDDIMAPQQLVFALAFCGDWASKVWGDSATCTRTGPRFDAAATKSREQIDVESVPGRCRAVDPLAESAPAQDCCTQFIYDADGTYGAHQYLQERAFFNISYVKVFTEEAS